MNLPESVEDLKKYILREIPKTRFIDFGLLYENDKGEYVVLNDVCMADIRLSSLVYLLVYVSTYCVPIASKQAVSITLFWPRPNNNCCLVSSIFRKNLYFCRFAENSKEIPTCKIFFQTPCFLLNFIVFVLSYYIVHNLDYQARSTRDKCLRIRTRPNNSFIQDILVPT